MNRKKICTLLLTSCLLLNSSITCFANGVVTANSTIEKIQHTSDIQKSKTNNETKISKEESINIAKEKLKNFFNITIDPTFKYSISLDKNSFTNNKNDYKWSIHWYSENYENDLTINVSIDANNGNLISFSKNQYSNNNSSIPVLSMKEALQVSQNFVKKINPKKLSSIELVKNPWYRNRYNSSNYSFNYVRKVNGTKFFNNNIAMTIDGTSGEIISYNLHWNNNQKFPTSTKIISKSEAEKIFYDNIKMESKYKRFQNKYEFENTENKKNVKLIYVPTLSDNRTIDANTGKFVQNSYKNKYHTETIELNKKELDNLYEKYKEIDKHEKTISKFEAEKIVKEIIIKYFGKDFVIKDLNYHENMNSNNSIPKSTWNADFTKTTMDKNNKEKIQNVYISINAFTGQLESLHKYDYDYDKDFTPKITWKQGYYKAIDMLADNFSDKIKNLDLKLSRKVYDDITEKENNYKERYYYYTFTRQENNIPYDANSITIRLNTKTGEISSINTHWDEDIIFENPNKSIAENKAKDILFNKCKPELQYIFNNKSPKPELTKNNSTENKNLENELKLVYTLEQNTSSYFIDAVNSKIINYQGEEVIFDISDFLKETKKSKYEKELNILAYKGLIDTKSFKLNKQVAKMDLIKTLVDALGYRPYSVMENTSAKMAVKEDADSSAIEGYTNKDYIKMAKYYGILDENIDNFNSKDLVTREEMAKSLIKFLNYDKIAKCSDIFTLNFEDANKIDRSNVGYIALAKGLGLVELSSNKFNPDNTATMEDLSYGLYKALCNKTKNNIIRPYYR